MKLRVDRVTVSGTGLEARRLADRLAQDLPAALARALAREPQAPVRDTMDRIAGTIAQRVRAELVLRQAAQEHGR